MIVDGKRIAERLLAAVRAQVSLCAETPRLFVLSIDPTFATKKYLSIKQKRAEEVGVTLELCELDSLGLTTEVVLQKMEDAQITCDGIILQLPYPAHIDVVRLLEHLPLAYDVDAIGSEAQEALQSGTELVLPPVVGAIQEIALTHGVIFAGARVTVVGEGRLVGKPAALWATRQGARVTVVPREIVDIGAYTRNADILILGAGVPSLIVPEDIQDGCVIFDAGTSEDEGKLVGDADPHCAEKTSLMTPVPGGIGPITIAKLFQNVLTLIQSSLL